MLIPVPKSETVPCTYCQKPTLMLGTRLCDVHWELQRRIRSDPQVARQILGQIEKQWKRVGRA